MKLFYINNYFKNKKLKSYIAINNSIFMNNTVSYSGSVMEVYLGSASFYNSLFQNNIAGTSNALFFLSAEATIFNCYFLINKAKEISKNF